MTHDDLTTALRDRVRDEHPDVDRLIRVSTRTGVRLRRRRAVGFTVAGVAVVGVGVVGAALVGPGSTMGSRPGIASEPTTTPSTAAGDYSPPIRIDAPGWRCDEPADQRVTCTKGGASVGVVWEWQSSAVAGKPDEIVVRGTRHFATGTAGGPFLVRMVRGPGATQADEAELWGHITRMAP